MPIWGWPMIRVIGQPAYRTCTYCLCILLWMSTASADDWEQFKSRCLGPMESISLQHPEDLLTDEAIQFAAAGSKSYVFDGSDSRLVLGDNPVSCMMYGLNLDENPFNWVEQMVAEGRYIKIPQAMSHGPLILQSTEWREPKMEVLIHWYSTGEGQALSAIETDLES